MGNIVNKKKGFNPKSTDEIDTATIDRIIEKYDFIYEKIKPFFDKAEKILDNLLFRDRDELTKEECKEFLNKEKDIINLLDQVIRKLVTIRYHTEDKETIYIINKRINDTNEMLVLIRKSFFYDTQNFLLCSIKDESEARPISVFSMKEQPITEEDLTTSVIFHY